MKFDNPKFDQKFFRLVRRASTALVELNLLRRGMVEGDRRDRVQLVEEDLAEAIREVMRPELEMAP